MADLTVVNPANFSGALEVSAVGTASDRFATTKGRKYLMRVNNAHTAPQNVVVDDPNSASPPGATAFNPDVTYSVTNATTKGILLEADRFADANGWINLVFGVAGVMNVQVYGPL